MRGSVTTRQRGGLARQRGGRKPGNPTDRPDVISHRGSGVRVALAARHKRRGPAGKRGIVPLRARSMVSPHRIRRGATPARALSKAWPAGAPPAGHALRTPSARRTWREDEGGPLRLPTRRRELRSLRDDPSHGKTRHPRILRGCETHLRIKTAPRQDTVRERRRANHRRRRPLVTQQDERRAEALTHQAIAFPYVRTA